MNLKMAEFMAMGVEEPGVSSRGVAAFIKQEAADTTLLISIADTLWPRGDSEADGRCCNIIAFRKKPSAPSQSYLGRTLELIHFLTSKPNRGSIAVQMFSSCFALQVCIANTQIDIIIIVTRAA